MPGILACDLKYTRTCSVTPEPKVCCCFQTLLLPYFVQPLQKEAGSLCKLVLQLHIKNSQKDRRPESIGLNYRKGI